MSRKTLPYILLIFIACFIHWLPSVAFDFINFDDPGFIEENYLIYLPPSETFIHSLSTTIRGNWVPLTFTSFSIDYHLHGLYGPAYHLTNILFHSLNTVFVFLIFRFLFNDFLPLKIQNNRVVSLDFIAALSALFWAIHPLRVEAVTWVSARKDVLFMFFCLWSILCYLYYIHQKASSLRGVFSNKYYLLTTLMMIFSLLAKGMAVTLPVVFLILDYLYQRKDYIRAFVEKIPLFAISLLISYIQISTRPDNLPGTHELGISTRIINSFSGLGFYIEKTILPLDLIPIYFYEGHKSDYFLYIFFSALATAVLLSILFLGGNRIVKASIAFYLVTSLPIIGIMQTWIQEYADRFSYLPTLPLYLWAGAGSYFLIVVLTKKLSQYTVCTSWKPFLGACSILLFIFFSYAYAGSKQIMIWETPYTLWDHQLSIRPSSRTCLVLGDYSMSIKSFDKAIHYYQYGFSLDPKDELILARIALLKEIFTDTSKTNKAAVKAH